VVMLAMVLRDAEREREREREECVVDSLWC
jgi:hypothetical protein